MSNTADLSQSDLDFAIDVLERLKAHSERHEPGAWRWHAELEAVISGMPSEDDLAEVEG